MAILICGFDPVFYVLQPIEYWYTRKNSTKKDVRSVGVRERICTIRLMEKVKWNPAAAEKLGIIVMNGPGDHKDPDLEKTKSE